MGRIVTAPYVTLRVPNDLGQEVTLGFYEGAPVPEGANREDVERLARKGMVSDERKAEKPAQPAAKADARAKS